MKIGFLSIMVLAAVLVLFVNVQEVKAETEKVNGFYGLENLFTDPKSEVKLYKSGGFSLKNFDVGLAIYAHPVSKTDMFKFTVLDWGDKTNDATKISRFIVDFHMLIDEEFGVVEHSVKKKPEITERIEPKSSIGSDMRKDEVPTNLKRDVEREPRIIVSLDKVTLIRVNDEYAPVVEVQNQDYEPISAEVNLDISRDGYTIKEISTSVEKGVWSPVINVLNDYYMPGFCYTVTVTATSGNYTDTAQDDFMVFGSGKYWDSSANPIDSDSHCNE